MARVRQLANALSPQTEELPPAERLVDDLCAPGYTGRKRGEIVRTRIVISQAHSSQWLGSFGNPGNGLYRAELRQALQAIGAISQHIISRRNTPCCALMDNMAQGR
jgi:hypothetical protein